MKRYEDNDELERALFALELEEPPAGLRSSILASTIYHVPASAAVRPWEVWVYGALCAAFVWLVVFVLRGTGAQTVDTALSYGTQALTFVSQPSVLFWIAIGGAATFWISQMNLTVSPGYQRTARR